jgi:hypothetical protein
MRNSAHWSGHLCKGRRSSEARVAYCKVRAGRDPQRSVMSRRTPEPAHSEPNRMRQLAQQSYKPEL